MRKNWFIKGMAMGAVLAFTLASGVGVQAKAPEDLAEVTMVSEAEFEALKPDGEATLEQKRQVVGDILLEAGVPEFMVEKLDGDMLESLYASPGFQVQTEYFKEMKDGNLEPISYEENEYIRTYNEQVEKKERNPLSEISMLSADGEIGIEIGVPGTGIASLSHVVIVGAPMENNRRLLIALAGWERSPIVRMKDFIGIASNNATTYDETAVLELDFTYTYNSSVSEEMSDEYTIFNSDFISDPFGIGKEIQLPLNSSWTDPYTGKIETRSVSDIVLGIRVEAKSDNSAFKVVSNYFHKRLSITGSISFSKNKYEFSASPSIAYDTSNASVTADN